MKLNEKICLLTTAFAGATTVCFAATDAVTRSLADWVSLVAEILSFLCLAVFILYTGKFLSNPSINKPEGEEQIKTSNGVKNGVMTALVGIALCQAVIIVAQVIFVK